MPNLQRSVPKSPFELGILQSRRRLATSTLLGMSPAAPQECMFAPATAGTRGRTSDLFVSWVAKRRGFCRYCALETLDCSKGHILGGQAGAQARSRWFGVLVNLDLGEGASTCISRSLVRWRHCLEEVAALPVRVGAERRRRRLCLLVVRGRRDETTRSLAHSLRACRQSPSLSSGCALTACRKSYSLGSRAYQAAFLGPLAWRARDWPGDRERVWAFQTAACTRPVPKSLA
jgi:hypothetical protein